MAADRKVGDVGVGHEPVARLELDGSSTVADERAIVDDGRPGATVVADTHPVTVVEHERRARHLTIASHHTAATVAATATAR